MGRHFVPMVRGVAVTPFVRYLAALGAPVERHLAAARLSPRVIEHGEELVPLRRGLAFLDHAARQLGCEHLGLTVGKTISVGALGTFGQYLLGGFNLRDAIGRATRAPALINSAERLWLSARHNGVLFNHAFSLRNAPGLRHGNAVTLMLMIDLVRNAAGPTWKPQAVRVPAADRNHCAAYERLIEAPVQSEGTAWAVVLDRALLAAPLPTRPAAAAAVAEMPSVDLAGSVRQVLTFIMQHGAPSIGQVAECAGVSIRTLQRELAHAGVTYAQLVERARFELAVKLLADRAVKVVDVAYEAGYTDAANFSRAFRRWTGMTPRQFRSERS